ncbi:sensor histidine kinase [Actinomadura rudentiformis]|uniref:Sensor histidine kinase n=1 Tax=Actinomadura rudentiformis TaxID=359158 RepID=A0A6H9Y8Q5_9ACTN|nr:sensor histidine kinase [Actinomadura rudentiformis]KAB2340584.1 sensor histidine kinase [Actinomadura rudentiformis]
MSQSRPWNMRRARWVLVAAHVPIVAISPVFIVFGTPGLPTPSVSIPMAVLAFLALGGLQLHHSLAVARGVRPPYGVLTLLALAVLVYAPMPVYTWNWVPTQVLLIASAPMVLPKWPAIGAIVAPLAGTAATAGILKAAWPVGSAFTLINGFVYWPIVLALMAASLYGSARLVQVVQELHNARTELAELAIGRERLRVSRDLHDLLGQSLSAISLKGDLALKLLDRDPPAAEAEMKSIVAVAQEALRDVRTVTREEHAVSLRTETEGAAALLRAASIDAQIRHELGDLPPKAEAVLAWALREGVTNVLRHSEASTCEIAIRRGDGAVRLEITNDGVRAASGPGSGLTGLRERARAVAGTVSASVTPGGGFRLCVEVPEESE